LGTAGLQSQRSRDLKIESTVWEHLQALEFLMKMKTNLTVIRDKLIELKSTNNTYISSEDLEINSHNGMVLFKERLTVFEDTLTITEELELSDFEISLVISLEDDEISRAFVSTSISTFINEIDPGDVQKNDFKQGRPLFSRRPFPAGIYRVPVQMDGQHNLLDFIDVYYKEMYFIDDLDKKMPFSRDLNLVFNSSWVIKWLLQFSFSLSSGSFNDRFLD
jgi:hypothetical protein